MENELIELFRQVFGDAVADEIEKHCDRLDDAADESPEDKRLRLIVAEEVKRAKEQIFDRISDAERIIMDKIDTLPRYTYIPWTTSPYPYTPCTPDPWSPYGPTVTY